LVHSTHPIPEEMRAIVDRAQQRLQRTALYDRTRDTNVFYCDSQWLFTAFARSKYRAGGVAALLLGQNVFIRRGDLFNDRMIGFSGKQVPANRPFSYFLAHELMHIAQARTADLITVYLLPGFIDKVQPVLDRQLKKGARVVSHDFEFKDWTPEKVQNVADDGEGRSHTLFLYRK